MRKSAYQPEQPLDFETIWALYEEIAAMNYLSCVAAATFATKFMFGEGSSYGGSADDVLKHLKIGYDKAAAYYGSKNH